MRKQINGKVAIVNVIETDVAGNPIVIEINGVQYKKQAGVVKSARISNSNDARLFIVTQ